jgi:hypothetical protein
MVMPENREAMIEGIKEVQARQQNEILMYQNVVGLGVGKKVTGGHESDEHCLTVFVDQKLPREAIHKDSRIPKTLDNIKTDVIETGVLFAGAGTLPATETAGLSGPSVAADVGIEVLTGRVRPAMGGYSVGHYLITAGTYSTAVTDTLPFPGMPQHTYILSNNHVLANSNNARIGDPILQPGPYDGGTVPRDVIARLSRFVPIKFITPTTTPVNLVDAAIAEGQFADLDREIYWIGYSRGAVAPAIGTLVQKTGRTTNYTTGRITAINATVNVNYGGGQVAQFQRQIVTGAMSAGGDSGSLLLDMDNHAVGLLFAGSSAATIFNDIRYVQQLLGIRIN